MTHPAERSAIEAAVQQQRFAISAEIHDSLLPYLFVTKMRLESLQHRLTSEQSNDNATAISYQQNLQLIEESIHSIDTAQRIGRNLLRSLDSDELLEDNWSGFLESILQRTAIGSEQLIVQGISDESLPRHVRVAVRGVAREAITNAIRHGQATQISVTLNEIDQPQYQLLIHDDGQGFEPAQHTMGYGTRFMHVRAATIGAKLAVDSRIGGPTVVQMTWQC